MAVTLAQAKLNTTDAVSVQVIDEFRKSSFLLDRLTFDDSVSPAGGGSTLTYGYTRKVTEAGAAFRSINSEYTPSEATKQRYTVDLVPLGGSFEIDRVLAALGPGSAQVGAEVAFQMQDKIKGARAFFADQFINGDVAVTTNGFDGLSKALAGSTTEVGANGPVLDFTAVDSQAKALLVMRRINAWLGLLDGTPDAILMNATALSWFLVIAGMAGQIDKTTDAFGRTIDTYRGIPLIDLGAKAASSNPVIAVYDGTNEVQTVTVDASSGNFTLSFAGYTTASIAEAATAAAVQSALEALPNLDSGDVTVSGSDGGPFTVTFKGRYAGINVPLMTAADVDLSGGGDTVGVTVATAGGGASGSGQTGLTDLYAVRFGLDGVHGVSTVGQLVKSWLPDFTQAGAVKKGEVEMGPVAPVLKATRAAGVLRNVKVG